MPVSCGYTCCNPECPDVLERLKAREGGEVELQQLRHFTTDGVLGPSASGHWTELKTLGATFFGHDTRVLLELPRRAHAMLKGLIFWEQGGCTDEFAAKLLSSREKLETLEQDGVATARARETAALESYLRFVRVHRTAR